MYTNRSTFNLDTFCHALHLDERADAIIDALEPEPIHVIHAERARKREGFRAGFRFGRGVLEDLA